MGGGYEALYYVDDSQKKTLPKEIIDTTDDKKTKPLIVLMSVGDKKYVKLKEAQESALVYGLNLGKSNEVIIKKNDRQSPVNTVGVLKTTMAF